mgnify:CR=1 FL=1
MFIIFVCLYANVIKKTALTNIFFKNIIFCCFVTVILLSCAKIGSPTGGPIDTTPPKVLKCVPSNHSLQFNASSFEIYFDEFVQIKNINAELIISPSIKKKPEVILRGKSIKVKLTEPLRPNLTYIFNFGDAIVDLNESNPLSGYEYVFSTGNHIDSLSLSGNVINAFTLQPPKEKCFVIIHDTIADSSLYNKTPLYVGKIDPAGNFAMRHLKNGQCMLFALCDANNNFRYDQPSESIAFFDSLLLLDGRFYVRPSDTASTDMLEKKKKNRNTTTAKEEQARHAAVPDTTTADTAALRTPKKEHIALRLFTEDIPKQQYLKHFVRNSKRSLQLVFNQPADSGFRLMNEWHATPWYIVEKNKNNDSLTLWITDTTIIEKERFVAIAHYLKTDTNGILQPFADTLKFSFSENKNIRKKKKDNDSTERKKEMLELILSEKEGAKHELNLPLWITAQHPIRSFNTARFLLFAIKDSTEKAVKKQISFCHSYSDKGDSIASLRRLRIDVPWEENTSYKLLLMPGAVNDIYGLYNDSLSVRFSSRPIDYYGKIILNLSGIDQPLIIQLLNSNENVLQTAYAEEDKKITFSFLAPDDYKLKIIFDANNNKKWDTGNYLKKQQPEKVMYYRETIKAKSNWDIELSWNVSSFSE